MNTGIGIATLIIGLLGLTSHCTMGAEPKGEVRHLADLTGSIAFYSSRDGNNEIYIVNAEGGQPVNLTRHPASDLCPVIQGKSPNSWQTFGGLLSYQGKQTETRTHWNKPDIRK